MAVDQVTARKAQDPAPAGSLRMSLHKLIWAALWPVRTYIGKFPFHRGKGLLVRRVIIPSLPPERFTFSYKLAHGATVPLRYRESFGRLVLEFGSYEAAEIAALCDLVVPGSVAIDVGANMGMVTLELSAAVGPSGRVISFEPNPVTAARLRRNLDSNGAANVTVIQEAVGRESGSITLNISGDDALSSIAIVPPGHSRSETVTLRRLDDVWRELGSPSVSVLKIDVEGAEADVLAGSGDLLRTCHPAILTEAWGQEELAQLSSQLADHGYELLNPVGFSKRNYIFHWPAERAGAA